MILNFIFCEKYQFYFTITHIFATNFKIIKTNDCLRTVE